MRFIMKEKSKTKIRKTNNKNRKEYKLIKSRKRERRNERKKIINHNKISTQKLNTERRNERIATENGINTE